MAIGSSHIAIATVIVCCLGVSVRAVSTAADQLWSVAETTPAMKLQAFIAWNNTIIRTRDSLEQGAQFLSAADSQQPAHCAEVCYTHPLCNTYVFDLNPGKPLCYLFNCGEPEPSLCLYAAHDGYISAEYHPDHTPDYVDSEDYRTYQSGYDGVLGETTTSIDEDREKVLTRVHKIDATIDTEDWVTDYYDEPKDETSYTTQYYTIDEGESEDSKDPLESPEDPSGTGHRTTQSSQRTFKEPIEWESTHHDSGAPDTDQTSSVGKGGQTGDNQDQMADKKDDEEADKKYDEEADKKDDEEANKKDDDVIPDINTPPKSNDDAKTPVDEGPAGGVRDEIIDAEEELSVSEGDTTSEGPGGETHVVTLEDDQYLFVKPIDYNERIFRMGAILPLAFGLLFSCTLLVVLFFRCRSAKARQKQGKPSPYSHDADYLINGMYL